MLEDAKKRMAENVICNLKKRNMEGIYCRDKKEAVETVLSLIEPGASIGWGGWLNWRNPDMRCGIIR